MNQLRNQQLTFIRGRIGRKVLGGEKNHNKNHAPTTTKSGEHVNTAMFFVMKWKAKETTNKPLSVFYTVKKFYMQTRMPQKRPRCPLRTCH